MKIGDLVRIQPHLTENRQWLVGLVIGIRPADGGSQLIAEVHWVNDGMREDTKLVEDLELFTKTDKKCP